MILWIAYGIHRIHLRSHLEIFWTNDRDWRMVINKMKRRLRIKVAFEPNRLSTRILHNAYEEIVPIKRRQIIRAKKQDEQTTLIEAPVKQMRAERM